MSAETFPACPCAVCDDDATSQPAAVGGDSTTAAGPSLPSGMTVAQYLELRGERCANCNTACFKSLGQRAPWLFFTRANDTNEPHHWQWLCRCLTTNVTRVSQ